MTVRGAQESTLKAAVMTIAHICESQKPKFFPEQALPFMQSLKANWVKGNCSVGH